MTGFGFKTFLAVLMVALGIVVPLPDFFGGMMIGMGCCYGVMIFTPPESRNSLFGTLFVGFMCCLLVAVLYPNVGLINWLPLQAAMGAGGALSKPLAQSCISFGESLVEWARGLPSRFRLPGGDK